MKDPGGKKKNQMGVCGLIFSPRNQSMLLLEPFSQNWVNVRAYGEFDENTAALKVWTLKLALVQLTHHSPLFVFSLWHATRSNLQFCSLGPG